MFGNPELTKRIAALEQEVARQQVVINEIIRQTGVEMPSGAGLPSNNEPSMYGNLPTTLPPRAQQALAAGKRSRRSSWYVRNTDLDSKRRRTSSKNSSAAKIQALG